MSNMISKPLQAILLVTAVLSVLALLKPEGLTASQAEDSLLSEHHDKRAASQADDHVMAPWLRTLVEPPQTASLAQGFAPPPAPPPVMPVVVAPPPEPPKPVVPTPAFTYLGRMIRDERTFVFLGSGEDIEVVAIGDPVDNNWRVESVSDTGVELRYMPLNETRQLAMGDK